MTVTVSGRTRRGFSGAVKSELASKVENATSYDKLFELVKQVVRIETGKHRAGLSLILSDMPNTVGAYHPVGSNIIVLNRSLIMDMKTSIGKDEEINSFVFTVLMHEYIHSLGLYDEYQVRKIVRDICASALGESHLTAKMAAGNWLEMYPQLARHPFELPKQPEYVQKFDSGSTSYLG